MSHINTKILNYCDANMGNKIARGECWDLAYHALKDNNGSVPTGTGASLYKWSKKVVSFSEALPGDVLQFSKYKIEFKEDSPNEIYEGEISFGLPRHTSIFINTRSNGKVEVYEQNMGNPAKKYVCKNEYYLVPGEYKSGNKTIEVKRVKGSLKIYRPELLKEKDLVLNTRKEEHLVWEEQGYRPKLSSKRTPFKSTV